MRLGRSKCVDVAFDVWNSITLNCAAFSRASRVPTSSIDGWPGHRAGSSCFTPAMLTFSACFWKKISPPTP
ncbi:hypothetical protein D9M69_627010 [compost metagenome]